jgi:hypothetical protein
MAVTGSQHTKKSKRDIAGCNISTKMDDNSASGAKNNNRIDNGGDGVTAHKKK